VFCAFALAAIGILVGANAVPTLAVEWVMLKGLIGVPLEGALYTRRIAYQCSLPYSTMPLSRIRVSFTYSIPVTTTFLVILLVLFAIDGGPSWPMVLVLEVALLILRWATETNAKDVPWAFLLRATAYGPVGRSGQPDLDACYDLFYKSSFLAALENFLRRITNKLGAIFVPRWRSNIDLERLDAPSRSSNNEERIPSHEYTDDWENVEDIQGSST
jgi:hypothetical protein